MKTSYGFLLLFAIFLLSSPLTHSNEEAPDSARAPQVNSFHIHIAVFFDCDESGRAVFTDPVKFSPGYPELSKHAVAQLDHSQIQSVRQVVENYTKDPAPFYVQDMAVDRIMEATEVRAGGKTRFSEVRAARLPEQLLKFYGDVIPIIKRVQVQGDPAIRDAVVERLETWQRVSRTRSDGPAKEIIANDEPAALFDRFVSDPGMKIDRKANFLLRLSTLKGTALGEKLYDFYQSQGKKLNKDLLLGYAIEGGSTHAIPEWRTVIFEPLPKKTDYLIRKILDPASIQTLASAIGQKDINDDYSMIAWDWLAAHTDRLQFDAGTHKFHIVGG